MEPKQSLVWIWENQYLLLKGFLSCNGENLFHFYAVVVWFSLINVCVVGDRGHVVFFRWWLCLESIKHVLLLRHPGKMTEKKNMMIFCFQSNPRLLLWPRIQKKYWLKLEDLFWQRKWNTQIQECFSLESRWDYLGQSWAVNHSLHSTIVYHRTLPV